MLRLLKRIHRSTQPRTGGWDMTVPVMRLDKRECIDLQRAMAGVFITGMTGSSKSTSSGVHLARGLVRSGCGGLVVTVKNDRPMWERLCKEEGRLKDLVIFNPSESWRFDPIGYEAKRTGPGGGLTENVATLVMTMVEFLARNGAQGGRDNEPYWRNACMQLMRNAIDLLLIAGESVSIQSIHRVVISAPQSVAQIREDPAWKQNSFCFQCLAEADAFPKTPREEADFGVVADYFMVEFPNLSERTRSVVVSQFTSTCDCLLRGVLRELFCGESNITPAAAEAGRIILVDMPLKQWGAVGMLANMLWKTAFQRSIERRDVKKSPRPVFLWQDEGHYYLHKNDALFQTTCRGSRCASILITQNIQNLDAALGTGEAGRAEAESLLANFGTLVFHCNTCQRSNEFAARLIGEHRVLMANGSTSRDANDPWTGAFGGHDGGGTSAGFSEQYRYVVEPSAFARLKAGGPAHKFEAEAIVIKSGELFRSTGTTWLPVKIKQDL